MPVVDLADEFGHAFAHTKGLAQTAIPQGGFRGRQYWKEHAYIFERAGFSKLFTESESALLKQAEEWAVKQGWGP